MTRRAQQLLALKIALNMALKIFQAQKSLAKLTAQFAAAGLDLEEFLAADDTALQAHLATLSSAPPAEALAQAEAALATLRADHAKLGATHSLLVTSLASAGLKLAAADEQAGLTAADIQKAVTDRIALKAAELTATLGTPPVDAPVSASPSAAAKGAPTQLTGMDRVRAATRIAGRN